MGVAAGGVDRGMAQQLLNQHQIGAGVELMGGETMPEAVRGVTQGQAGLDAGALEDLPRGIQRDGTLGLGAGKQPDTRPSQAPVAHWRALRRVILNVVAAVPAL